MTLTDLAVVYGALGVVSAVAVQRISPARGARAVVGIALSVALWPLWLPVVLTAGAAREKAEFALASETELALEQAHASVENGPLAGVLPRGAVNRIIAEVRRATERHAELEALLAGNAFDLDLAKEHLLRLERERASPRSLSSARLHLQNIERLQALRARDRGTLAELRELSQALRTQLVVARFAGSSASDASDIVAEVWARVEVLGDALDAPTNLHDIEA